MFVNWEEVQKALSPIKDFNDLSTRLQRSFSFAFVNDAFNYSLEALSSYIDRLLGGDSRQRYGEYVEKLKRILRGLSTTGVPDVSSLIASAASPGEFENFHSQHGLNPLDTVFLLKFLVYWFIPGEKYLSGLVRADPEASAAINKLQGVGIRTNLELLHSGLTPPDRISLAHKSGLPLETVEKLVNIADFSRLPWASKATIANFFGAGYPSMAALSRAEPEKLYADFFAYGKSIGKNLKLGNEIENSYRIARIVPPLVQAGSPAIS